MINISSVRILLRNRRTHETLAFLLVFLPLLMATPVAEGNENARAEDRTTSSVEEPSEAKLAASLSSLQPSAPSASSNRWEFAITPLSPRKIPSTLYSNDLRKS